MLFTIVIPVYNVGPYLRDCLNSVLSQTYSDWEAICVDDGSTDGSSQILDEYASKDPRFKIMHQHNAGVGPARNKGLDAATGKWIVFLDGDDVYSPWAFDTLSKSIVNHPGADIHAFKLQRFNDKESVIWKAPGGIRTTIYELKVSVPDNAPTSFFWSKAYSRSLLEGVRFPNLIVGEDLVFIMKTMELASEQVNIDVCIYGYRQRASSVMHSAITEKIVEGQIAYAAEVLCIMANSSKRYSKGLIRQYANTEVERVADSLLRINKEAFAQLRVLWLSALQSVKDSRLLNLFQRMRMKLLLLFNGRLAIWFFGALPYRLKANGFHR